VGRHLGFCLFPTFQKEIATDTSNCDDNNNHYYNCRANSFFFQPASPPMQVALRCLLFFLPTLENGLKMWNKLPKMTINCFWALEKWAV